jgi:hypothetical protein
VNPTVHSIPENFKNIIIGSYFGDGCITTNAYKKHYYMKISHGINQIEYCKWKANLLGDFATEPIIINRTFKNKPYQCVSFTTKMFPFFEQLHNCYINNQKHIKNWMFTYLDPLALTIWYLDDGDFSMKRHVRKDGTDYRSFGGCRIALGVFSEEECTLITNFFVSKYSIEPKIYVESGKYHRLWFNVEKSKRFIEIIKPFVPECMNYKIGIQQETIDIKSIDDIV